MSSKLFSKTSDAEDGVNTVPSAIPSSDTMHDDLEAYMPFYMPEKVETDSPFKPPFLRVSCRSWLVSRSIVCIYTPKAGS